MNRLIAVIAAGLLSATPALALFGSGDKKEPEHIQAPKGGALPGLEGTAGAPEAPPSMAVEAAQATPAAPAPSAPNYGAEAPVSENETAVGNSPSGEMPQEVVIRGEGDNKLKNVKPPLQITTDPFESIRDTLKPDENLLLAESPLAVVWRRTHPEFLRNPRVVQPWRTLFSERPGMIFRPRDLLAEVLGRKVDPKELKGYQWSLTIADEEGKVFHHYEGSSSPPEEIIWTGQNDQDEWIKAGKAYSPVYMFTDPAGTPYTRADKPIKYKGVVHQERTGLHMTLDSTALFGSMKDASGTVGEGEGVLRAAADLIKRRYPGVPLRVEAYSGTKELAEKQARTVQDYLQRELMLMPQDVSTDSDRATFSDQRIEIILLNR